MSDIQAVWYFDPRCRLRYYYDERFDQIVYETGFRTARPSNLSRESLLGSGNQTVTGDPNAPRTIPQHPLTVTTQRNTTPAAGAYVFATANQPQTSPFSSRPSSFTFEQDVSGRPTYLSNPGSSPPRADLSAILDSMYIGASNRRGSFHPPVARTPQITQGNVMQVYTTPASMLRSTQQIPEPVSEADMRLYATFKRREKTRRFFVVGKVFLTLWTEPAGDVGSNYTAITSGRYGEPVFSKIRRFVIVRAGENSCAALPILTYGYRGVAKQGVKKSEHAIVFTGREAPEPHHTERPRRDEEGLLPQPIRVDADDAAEKLDPWSRIDFGKVYNIEHNVKVRSLGKVNPASMSPLLVQFRAVWEGNSGGPGSQLRIQTPRGLLTETVGQSPQQADFMAVYNTLLANGFTTEQIRSVLRVEFQLPSAVNTGSMVEEHEEGQARKDGESSDEAEQDAEDTVSGV